MFRKLALSLILLASSCSSETLVSYKVTSKLIELEGSLVQLIVFTL